MRLYAQPAEQFQLSEGTEGGWMGWLAGSQAGERAGGRVGAAGADDADVMHGQIKLPHVTLRDLQPFRYSGTLTQLPPQHTRCTSINPTPTRYSHRNFKGA